MSLNARLRAQLLVTGYVREHGEEYKLIIPNELSELFTIFYPMNFEFYSFGHEPFETMRLPNQFGQKQHAKEETYHLHELSELCKDPKWLSIHDGGTFIRNVEDNKVYVCGENQNACLGIPVDRDNDEIEHIKHFTPLSFEHDIDDIIQYNLDIINKGGPVNKHKFVVFTDNVTNKQTFYGFGINACHELGYPPKDDDDKMNFNLKNPLTPIPILNKVFMNQNIIEISTGYHHSLFLSSSGKVFGCGLATEGACGIRTDFANEIAFVSPPEIIPFLYDIISINCGSDHSLCLDKNGFVWAFGSNRDNMLALGPDFDAESAVYSATKNPYLKGIKNIECGSSHNLCIDDKGKVFMFGLNHSGQCGNGEKGKDAYVNIPYCINDNYSEIKDVVFENGSCGSNHTMLLSIDGELYGLGRCGRFGQTHSNPVLYTNSMLGINKNMNILNVFSTSSEFVIVCQQLSYSE